MSKIYVVTSVAGYHESSEDDPEVIGAFKKRASAIEFMKEQCRTFMLQKNVELTDDGYDEDDVFHEGDIVEEDNTVCLAEEFFCTVYELELLP